VSNYDVDENVSDAVKLAAIRDALDRAGLSARTAVSVAIAPQPWEQIFDDITGGSRAESRARRGMPDDGLEERHPPALVRGGDATPIVDAEVIRPEPEPDCTDFLDSSSVERASHAGRRTYSVRDFSR
jgi:hypothetical protein